MPIPREDSLRDRYDRIQEHQPAEVDEDAAYERWRDELEDEVMRRDQDAMLLRLCDGPED